jgi:multiple sugar transport system permease protein
MSYRGRRRLTKAGGIALGAGLLIWTLLPVYNMLLMALDDEADEFTGSIFPPDPNLDSFRSVWNEDYWLMDHFWHQFANSLFLGVATMVLTVLLGSLVAFSLGRMRLRRGWIISDMSLLTYLLPAAFLVIPFVHIMRQYGLSDSIWAVIAAEVTFATPYAILILNHYGKLIPMELDEAARIDGASPIQMYSRIYVPLMAPALVAVGIYALLLSWNEYLYQYLLLSSTNNMTVAVMINQFFDTDEAPWNYMMAIALIYSIPPIVIFFGLRRYMVAGLTLGGVKG